MARYFGVMIVLVMMFSFMFPDAIGLSDFLLGAVLMVRQIMEVLK